MTKKKNIYRFLGRRALSIILCILLLATSITVAGISFKQPVLSSETMSSEQSDSLLETISSEQSDSLSETIEQLSLAI